MTGEVFQGGLNVVVLDVEDHFSPIEIYNTISRLSIARKNRRFNMLFLTRLDHNKFYERYRDILLNNISLSLSIKRVEVTDCGKAIEMLKNAVKTLGKPIVIPDRKCAGLVEELEKTGVVEVVR
ncbi:MAG: hypothetical protein JHC12_04615 [Thermogladius sp.]|nr:hypothetical protein [Thermogladius sp.]